MTFWRALFLLFLLFVFPAQSLAFASSLALLIVLPLNTGQELLDAGAAHLSRSRWSIAFLVSKKLCTLAWSMRTYYAPTACVGGVKIHTHVHTHTHTSLISLAETLNHFRIQTQTETPNRPRLFRLCRSDLTGRCSWRRTARLPAASAITSTASATRTQNPTLYVMCSYLLISLPRSSYILRALRRGFACPLPLGSAFSHRQGIV